MTISAAGRRNVRTQSRRRRFDEGHRKEGIEIEGLFVEGAYFLKAEA
ncbi:hypothetical protein ACFYU5_23280 [Nocardia aobensis]|jgi:hypothetical protein|uniref:Uncharacterized protein n=1 Tax=Nocardia aobensis TaxID=257277 RepID=A0ABW6P890_9NOCA|nr:hypothetical protein [Nocardia cerradoensis]NKY47120.1 hypothetical protein [Nocardia cerradoensis]